MGKSYKKTPYVGEKKHKTDKRAANKRVRRMNFDDTVNYKGYKKTYPTWNICDYSDISTFEEFYDAIKQKGNCTNKEEMYQYWCKFYKRK